jgi:hypothetical protein
MLIYFISSVAAWVAVGLVACEIVLPYAIRRTRVTAWMGISPETGYLQRMWPHYWIGYAIAGLSFAHAFSVGSSMMRAAQLGIWMATLAFLMLLIQVFLGLYLQTATATARIRIRRLHFWAMIIFVGLLAAHLWLNA